MIPGRQQALNVVLRVGEVMKSPNKMFVGIGAGAVPLSPKTP